ncbi:hypothetical protein [Celeribacter marinus]|uniref:hypothetical protein n=1 Tax=Celeribacter marinus TaxID=1397108 RepID=UPI00317129BF
MLSDLVGGVSVSEDDMTPKHCILTIVATFIGVAPMRAEPVSLLGLHALPRTTSSLMEASPRPLPIAFRETEPRSPSLFSDREAGTFFAPLPPRVELAPKRPTIGLQHLAGPPKDVEWIRKIIGRAESGAAGYDAVQHGAKRKTPKRPTAMTLGEIFAWIKDTPGQPHAIGLYQFIPKTLSRLVDRLELSDDVMFSPDVQDRLSDLLLEEAGLLDARRGAMSRKVFMNNLAKIWAGLPTSNGKSYYHGHAGNRATVTWAEFDKVMVQAFPARVAQNDVPAVK